MVYSLKYELGGGEGIEHQRKLKGGKFAVTDEIPARKGYDFIGWTDDKDSKEPNVKAGDVYSEDADITLYAIWKEAKYTVTFYDEDGTVLHSEECDFNAWVPTVEEPTKESDGEYKYVFAGWTPELVQVVVKDLEYTATYEKIALTEEEKAQLNASAESEEKAASDDKDGGIPSYVYIIIGVLLVVAGVLIVFKNKIFSKKAND